MGIHTDAYLQEQPPTVSCSQSPDRRREEGREEPRRREEEEDSLACTWVVYKDSPEAESCLGQGEGVERMEGAFL